MRPIVIFYFLVFYILLQFGWWAYLLTELNQEIYTYKTENLQLKSTGPVDKKEQEFFQKTLRSKWAMVIGEGTVFFSLLIFGIIRLRRALANELALAQQQKNFVLSITHELKSPLASIKLYLQTLQKRDIEKEKQQAFISNAISDTERLHTLVENILLAAQIENPSGNGLFRKERINLSELVKETTEVFATSAPIRLNVATQITPDLYCEADSMAFSSVVNNLLENAVKYSHENAKIRIGLEQLDDKLVLTVKDEGPGIPDEEKQKIFEKFYRIGNEEIRTAKGTGLGLYIIKHIVENHNGKILVKNNSPKGSIFEVWIPQ